MINTIVDSLISFSDEDCCKTKMEAVSDRKTIVKYWILEYYCQSLCSIFSNINSPGVFNKKIESIYTIITELITSFPNWQSLDIAHTSWILMSEMCIRLVKRDFHFPEYDNFSSINDFITYICQQFSVPQSEVGSLCRSFNAQLVLHYHSKGLSKEAKEAFSKFSSDKEIVNQDEIESIINSEADIEIPEYLSYTFFLHEMKEMVRRIQDITGPPLLEQVAGIFDFKDQEDNFSKSELMSLFQYHMKQKKMQSRVDEDGTLNSDDDNSRAGIEKRHGGKRARTKRKLLNAKRAKLDVHIDNKNIKSQETEDSPRSVVSKTYTELKDTEKQNGIIHNPKGTEIFEFTASLESAAMKKREGPCTITKANVSDSESAAAEETIVNNVDHLCKPVEPDFVSVRKDEKEQLLIENCVDETMNRTPVKTSRKAEKRMTSSPIKSVSPDVAKEIILKSPEIRLSPVELPASIVSSNKMRGRRVASSRSSTSDETDNETSSSPLSSKQRLVHSEPDELLIATVDASKNTSKQNGEFEKGRGRRNTNNKSTDYSIPPETATENGQAESDSCDDISEIWSPSPKSSSSKWVSTTPQNRIDESTSRSGTTAKKRKPFTGEEVNYLRRGVAKFGVGHWTAILKAYPFRSRTSVNLKDKWRNLMKKEGEL